MTAALRPTPSPTIAVENARFGNGLPLAVIAGPCVLESRGHALETASALKEIARRLGIGLVYKSSFDKANRTNLARAGGRTERGASHLRRDQGRRWACRHHGRSRAGPVRCGRGGGRYLADSGLP